MKCDKCMRDKEYRAEFRKGQALRLTLTLFDEHAYTERSARAISHPHPGISYALEKRWFEGEDGMYWLTGKGILIAADLADEREEWYLSMADKVKP